MKTVTIFYDNWCPNCTKFVNLIQKLNWLGLVQLKQLRKDSDIAFFSEIDIKLAHKQMASFTIKWHYGYMSLYLIFKRIPLFWILLPIFWTLKITNLGQYLYLELALKRKIIPLHCDLETCNSIISDTNS